MRPTSIRLFTLFHLAATALVLVNNLLFWDFNVAAADPRFGELAPLVPASITATALFVPLLLYYLLVFRRSNVARWIIGGIVLFWAGGVVVAVGKFPTLMVTITASALALQIAGFCYLYTPPARQWFARSG